MKRVTLGDVCAKSGSNIAQKDLAGHSGQYPIYGASGFIQNVDFYQQDAPYIAVVKDGAGIGRTMLLPAKSSVIGTMQYIIPKDDQPILLKYLYHAIVSMNLGKYFSGATIPHIYFKDYQKEPLNLPDLPTQRRIVATLDAITTLMAKRHQQLDALDQLVKARFVEMFGDCKTNPKHWNVCNLEDIAEVGSSKRVFVEELQESGIPFYRGTEVGALAEGKEIVPELFITEEHYQELCDATGKPKVGDLLMPSICPDGRIWLVNTEEPFYFKDGRVLWVHPISSEFNSTFLLYTLKDRIVSDYSNVASGTTFAELKIFSLKRCGIFEVPLCLQNLFAEFINQVNKSKLTIKQSLHSLETLKKSLMQQYFG